jgi:metal-responsive CopG/Arc/MetJ family transcriptional regulator
MKKLYENKAIQICVSIKPDLNKKLEKMSKETYISKSKLITLALERYMEEQKG